jgi:hypothetical protein
VADLHNVSTASSGLFRTKTINSGFCHALFSFAIVFTPFLK